MNARAPDGVKHSKRQTWRIDQCPLGSAMILRRSFVFLLASAISLSTLLADEGNGRYTTPNPSDFGAGAPSDPIGPGTYFVGHISLSLSGLAPGIYTLQTTTVSGRICEISSFDETTGFSEEPIPAATYTITIVPEPSTLALLVFSTLGLVATFWRRGTTANSLKTTWNQLKLASGE